MLQVPSSLPPCVPCPNAVAATNAQATTKGAIMFLTNFIFISVISFIVLAFLGFPPWEVISGRSPEYRTETSARLRGKCRRHACHYRDYFGASEETIFSKRGSPRRGSHHGISFNSP